MTDSFSHKVRGAIDRFFPERQVIHRSRGQVRFVTLSSGSQIAMTMAALAALGWVAFVSASYVDRKLTIAAKDDRIAQVERDYSRLAEALESQQDRMLAITRELEANHRQIIGLIDYKLTLERRLSSLTHELDRATEARDGAEQSRQSLGRRVTQLEGSLKGSTGRNEALESRLSSVTADLAAVIAERDAVRESAQAVSKRLAGLETELKSTAGERDKIDRRLAAATAKLDQVAAERDSAIKATRELAGRVEKTENRLALAQRNLGESQGERERSRSENKELSAQVATLERRVAEMRISQAGLVAGTTSRARESVQTIEQIIAMTGIKVDEMARVARGELGEAALPVASGGVGLGGPLIGLPADIDTTMSRQARPLEAALGRYSGLSAVVGRMPLGFPMREGSIASGFGRRIDPFTGSWSMHQGIDIRPSNRAGARPDIHVTAPGTVTFAGFSGPYGRLIEVDHGLELTTRYAHLSTIKVKVGQRLLAGDVIGVMGSSGRSSGAHLHYEVLFRGHPMDPARFVAAGSHLGVH
ncbi:MAG: hypothetical protein FJX46_11700 [Alphaproteobacteria bacterium]|nr:hypothetical protein [Alphaproteobacteria bacterium]